MTMREKIARAICAEMARSWDDRDGYYRGEWFDLADAALSAMREPSEAVLEAGYNASEQYGMADNRRELHRMKMLPRWQAMIDAAIQEKGE